MTAIPSEEIMEYNVYDFDKTIYLKDSTTDFYFYCLRRYPSILAEVPITGAYFALYNLKRCSKTIFKEKMYRFLRHLPDVDQLVLDFWEEHKGNMASYYKEVQRPDDIIISASPEFLLEPIAKIMGFGTLMASRVDKKTGIYDGINCHGKEKVRRLKERFPDAEVNRFYSDSFSDTPLAVIAKEAFLVKDGKPVPWPWK